MRPTRFGRPDPRSRVRLPRGALPADKVVEASAARRATLLRGVPHGEHGHGSQPCRQGEHARDGLILKRADPAGAEPLRAGGELRVGTSDRRG